MGLRRALPTACLVVWLNAPPVGAAAPEAEITINVEKTDDGFHVTATAEVPTPLRTAWAVLTDFDRMTAVMSNLESSKVVERNGNTLRVVQQGTARYGPFSYPFTSEREIRLTPMRAIDSRQISGSARRFESSMRLVANGSGTHLDYSADIVPDSGVAWFFGRPFVRHEMEEQLSAMTGEMIRRHAAP